MIRARGQQDIFEPDQFNALSTGSKPLRRRFSTHRKQTLITFFATVTGTISSL